MNLQKPTMRTMKYKSKDGNVLNLSIDDATYQKIIANPDFATAWFNTIEGYIAADKAKETQAGTPLPSTSSLGLEVAL
ncbi:hypothetical protein SNE40_021956 [Patella caerulea]|uniref:Uncharacterized protein n=1 Tax=Patella caerulea TaxID=87958 RepID=A0AAN8GH01_PATCE